MHCFIVFTLSHTLPYLTFPLLKMLTLHKLEHLLCAECCAKCLIGMQNVFIKQITVETTFF